LSERASKAYLDQVFEQVKNWGRWGPDDERGALNYITDDKRRSASRLVQDGVAISCSREFPVTPSPENPTPAQHMMVMAGDARDATGVPGLETALDYIGVAFHGMAVSHIDALCHVFVDGKMYNGFAAEDVKSIGALHNSILVAGDGISGRGVLLDLPRLRGVDWLEPGEAVAATELMEAERTQGVSVEEGDLLLVHTGRDARRQAVGVWDPVAEGLAGLHPDCAPWLHERRIAVLGCDGISDPLPNNAAPGWPIPIHQCCLVAMGVHLLDNLRLDRLAAACAERRRWEFWLTVAPLRIARATGSPVNPVAIL
jgi:kynurenine formamidase